jgi:16S rRNA (cytidine1402-2'-O)-methyltransferase
MDKNAKLFIVPTPIGNLGDITYRAVQVLHNVDCILAEDTRTSSVLLKHYAINTKLVSHHKFNERKTLEHTIKELQNGKTYALISDAGTPAISDPGHLLIAACIAHNIPIETLPGATAFVPALVNSGFQTDTFVFIGFLPVKKGRETKFKELAAEKRTVILYESPYRLVKTLEQCMQYFPDRRISISRELSKKFEETVRGKAGELIQHFTKKEPKGEFVLVIDSV